MQLSPYLFYNDNCEAAFKFYEKVLGARIEALIRAEEAPADMPSTAEGFGMCTDRFGIPWMVNSPLEGM